MSRNVRGRADQHRGRAVGEHHLPGRVDHRERYSGCQPGVSKGGRQQSAAVVGPLPQLGLGGRGHPAEPGQHRIGHCHFPAGDVENGERIVGDDVTDGDTGARPWMKALAPVLGAPDHDGAMAFQCGSHAIGPARPLRPGGPGSQVAVRGQAADAPAAPARQDAPVGIGHGDEAVEAADLGRSGRGQAAELGEHHVMLDRVGTHLGCGGGPVQAGIDLVLLPAPVPGHEDLGAYPPDGIGAGREAFPCGRDRLEAVAREHGSARCG